MGCDEETSSLVMEMRRTRGGAGQRRGIMGGRRTAVGKEVDVGKRFSRGRDVEEAARRRGEGDSSVDTAQRIAHGDGRRRRGGVGDSRRQWERRSMRARGLWEVETQER